MKNFPIFYSEILQTGVVLRFFHEVFLNRIIKKKPHGA